MNDDIDETTHEEILEVSQRRIPDMQKLLKAVLSNLSFSL